MRITISVNLKDGKPFNSKLLDLLFDVARKLNGTVTTTQRVTKRLL